MAQFRKNHQKQQGRGAGNQIIKVGIFTGIVGLLFWVFNTFLGDKLVPDTQEPTTEQATVDIATKPASYFLPDGGEGKLIEHDYYTLSYSEEHEQAEWVAYELNKEQLQMPWVERTNNFRPDPKVPKASASPRDYYGTGYSRGHLVPAADRAFSKEAMSETFYMSNISPQIHNFNGGVWRELEELTRKWAKQAKHLYVVTGPILKVGVRERIGGNQVSVPDAFYKVLLDYTEPEIKAIGFLIPNEISTRRLYTYAKPIDTIEKLTGLDFFAELLPDEEEEVLESEVNTDLWPLDFKKENKRMQEWNKKK